MEKILVPRNIINVKGNLYYKESNQAWCILRLRKEILNEFYQLKEKSSKFSYTMIYYRSYEELEKSIRELKKKNEALPVLMWLWKDT